MKAALHAEVQRQAQLQAELRRARATEAALVAALKKSQEEQRKEIADQDFRFASSHLQEQKLDILLQGFEAISGVFNNLAFTSAVMMGFASSMYVLQQVDNCRREMKYIFWSLALLTIKLLVQAVFVSTLSITDSTKLCFQGTRGQDDVRRAFHGLMAQRSEVFYNFIGGFVTFILLYVFLVWVKIEQDSSERLENDDYDVYIFGVILSIVGWFIPVLRMARAYRMTRRQFKIDYSGDRVKDRESEEWWDKTIQDQDGSAGSSWESDEESDDGRNSGQWDRGAFVREKVEGERRRAASAAAAASPIAAAALRAALADPDY
eukprot:gene7255-6877_t